VTGIALRPAEQSNPGLLTHLKNNATVICIDKPQLCGKLKFRNPKTGRIIGFELP
jgi:hypothetical protein